MEHSVRDAFYRWLTDTKGCSSATAQEYTRSVFEHVQVWIDRRQMDARSLEQRNIAQIYEIHCRSYMDLAGKYRSALAHYLDFCVASAGPLPVPDGGLCLSDVLDALHQNRGNKACKTHSRIMRVLLRNEDYHADRPSERSRDLSCAGEKYPMYRLVAAQNLESHPEELHSGLWDCLTALDEDCEHIREHLHRMAGSLLKTYEHHPHFSGSATETLLLRIRGLNPWAASAARFFVDWYQAVPLKSHIPALLAELIAQSLRCSGHGFSQIQEVPAEGRSAQRLCALLAPFRTALQEGLLRGAELEGSRQIARFLELGLVRVEKPAKQPPCLVPTQALSPFDDSEEVTREIWRDPALCELMLKLLDRLDPAKYSDTSLEIAFALANELIDLLAAALPENEMTNGISKKAMELLTTVLVCCYCRVRNGSDARGVEAQYQLIALYRARPSAAENALAIAIDNKWMDESEISLAPAMLERNHNGESLLLVRLYQQYADKALGLANSDALPPEQQEYFAVCAMSASEQSGAMARRLEEYRAVFDAELRHAEALCRSALLAKRQREVAESECIEDFLAPCAAAFGRCTDLLRKELPQQKDLAEALGGSFSSEEIRERRERLKQAIAVCTAQTGGMLSELLEQAPPAPCPLSERPAAIWIPENLEMQLFRPWYCAYMDSGVTLRKQYTQDQIEGNLLKVLLSGQNVVLTLNQLVDNRLLRALAHVPGFLWTLRTGHVAVSFYGPYSDLLHYAADQMQKPNKTFQWSSLPEDFGADDGARQIAARYLRDECGEAALPLRFRNLLIQFKEELKLLDEALPAGVKCRFYQRRKAPTLQQRLNNYFEYRMELPQFSDLCRLHRMIADAIPPDHFNRSAYQKQLSLIKVGDYRDMALGRRQQDWLDQKIDTNLLDNLQIVLDDCQNRMLGSLCTDFQHHLYSEAERALMPYDESDPVTARGCRVFRDIQCMTAAGLAVRWDQVPERIHEIQSFAAEHDCRTAEQLANRLRYQEIDYEASEEGTLLVMRRVIFRTSNNRLQKIENSETGMIHMETEGL